VAVILDAEDLEDPDMQRIARWTNLSETTFVLPPATGRGDYRLRIFTPAGELPFAGHPTLGSAHAWLGRGGAPKEPGCLVQECDAGLGWAVVRLATAREVLELQPDLSRIPTAMVGAIGAYPDGNEHAFELRTFAPGVGVAEDPVCGSMNASVAQWLLRTGAVPGSYRVSQGRRLDRAGDVTITADPGGTIWVGGNTSTLFQGAVFA
jgi:predicted PhzF superfamily epimerase YddE/YHI9